MADLIETQKAVIGSVFIDNSCIGEIYGLLTPEHFASLKLRRIYKEILYLYSNNEPITVLSVHNRIVDSKNDSNEVSLILRECLNDTLTSAQIKYHAQILADNYKAKRFREISSIPADGDINEIIGDRINQLTALLKEKETGSKTLADIYKENKYKYFNPDYDPNFLELGFPKLDEILGGIEDTDLVCIGARPSVGKSALVANIALKVSKEKKITFYTLEMNDKQVLDRIVALESGIELSHVRHSKEFFGDEELRFNDMDSRMSNAKNLIVNDKGAKKVSEIRNECKFIDGLGLIIIDYLQLIRPEKSTGNRVNDIGDISRSLKAMTMELKVPVLILSQLNRSLEYRATKEPTLADLRESGDIEQDCNTVIFLWNEDEEDRSVKCVRIAKNRQGILGKTRMKFKGGNMKFYEIDDAYSPRSIDKGIKQDKDGFMSIADDVPLPF